MMSDKDHEEQDPVADPSANIRRGDLPSDWVEDNESLENEFPPDLGNSLPTAAYHSQQPEKNTEEKGNTDHTYPRNNLPSCENISSWEVINSDCGSAESNLIKPYWKHIFDVDDGRRISPPWQFRFEYECENERLDLEDALFLSEELSHDAPYMSEYTVELDDPQSESNNEGRCTTPPVHFTYDSEKQCWVGKVPDHVVAKYTGALGKSPISGPSDSESQMSVNMMPQNFSAPFSPLHHHEKLSSETTPGTIGDDYMILSSVPSPKQTPCSKETKRVPTPETSERETEMSGSYWTMREHEHCAGHFRALGKQEPEEKKGIVGAWDLLHSQSDEGCFSSEEGYRSEENFEDGSNKQRRFICTEETGAMNKEPGYPKRASKKNSDNDSGSTPELEDIPPRFVCEKETGAINKKPGYLTRKSKVKSSKGK